MSTTPDSADARLLALLVRCVTIVLVTLIAGATSCTVHANYVSEQAIEKGADPVAVACAFSVDSGNTCSLAAARGVKP